MPERTDRNTPDWCIRAEAAKLSLEWIAVHTGVSYSTVYAYKMGRRTAQKPWLDRVDELLAGQGQPSGSPSGV